MAGLPMIDTEVLIAVSGEWGEADRWVPAVVIEHDGDWFTIRWEGELVDFPLHNENETWKRIR